MHAASLTIEEQKNWNIEQRKLDILDRLKAQNGPFTCVEDIDVYLHTLIRKSSRGLEMR